MPVYTLVNESKSAKNIYSDEAINLAEAAVNLTIQENLVGDTFKNAIDVGKIKLRDTKDTAKSKLIDLADRTIHKGEAKNANRKVNKSEGKHVKEDEAALREYNTLRKKIKWNGKEFVGGTPEERERYVQIANALNLQNKIQ